MSKKLVIVESPAKCKTISKYLGTDYILASSYGHIRDLPDKKIGIDIDNNFEPQYETLKDKAKVIKELKGHLKSASEVYLATDPDREGEAIAWHLFHALKLDAAHTKRIVFNEITKSAIQSAISEPRNINEALVDAQQARRVLDRIVGFEISPILWRKVKFGLSAGRVQSVAVRLIVEREREIISFTPEPYFKITARLTTPSGEAFTAEFSKRVANKDDARAILEQCKNLCFEVKTIEKKPSKRSPSAPFTTSSLQQEASRKLGFSVSQTMTLAQRLYEAGLITYMRTDSQSLSQEALTALREHITKEYGEAFAQTRSYQSKIKGAQEAHEAIRPTSLSQDYTGNEPREEKLYTLIKKRAIASQMADARIERTTITLSPESTNLTFQSKGEMISFEGFLKVYSESSDDDTPPSFLSKKLPNLKEADRLAYDTVDAVERFTRHLPRYTEASLVKKLEELGIGRPSTYAPTISTIQKRQYVEKSEREGTLRPFLVLTLKESQIKNHTEEEMTGKESGKLFPTDIGMVTTDFLVTSFTDILDYQFTASLEKEFDQIAEGQKAWQKMIQSFYTPFNKNAAYVKEHSKRASGERCLGVDPKTNKNVYVRIGRFGPIAQIGESPDKSDTDAEKPQFASLQKNQQLETITLEEALDLFKFPKVLGLFEDKELSVAIGRFGPYIKHDSKFYPLKGLDIHTVTLDEACQRVIEKRELDKEKIIAVFDNHDPVVKVQNGPYGPYVSIGKKNIKIPKEVDPKTLTLEACLAIKPPPKRRKNSRKK